MTATAYATFGSLRIVSGSINLPMYGAWVADLVFALTDNVPSTPTPLVLGNLTLTGTVIRTANFAGARSARIVAGAAGWRNNVTARAYQNPGGISLSTVLGDAAAEVGEQVNVVAASNGSIGTDFIRRAAPASRLLRYLAGPVWYIDNAGVTQVAPARSSTAITSDFQVTEWSGGKGLFQIAAEDVASWQPGNTFTSPVTVATQTISTTRLDIDNDGTFRLHVLTAT